MNMVNASATTAVRSRLIEEPDLSMVATLLASGFPLRTRDYWEKGLRRLAARPPISEVPRFGYMLEAEGRVVGVLLLLFSTRTDETGTRLQGNISSWYAEPSYRGYASLLVARAMKVKQATLINISPAPHTFETIEAQGFRRYSAGQFLCAPALAPLKEAIEIETLAQSVAARGQEAELLSAHEQFGCFPLWAALNGEKQPLLFLPRRLKGFVPFVQLVYCRREADLAALLPGIGRHFARRGRPLILVDSNGLLKGIPGHYVASKSPRYYRGPVQPVLNDLAFTELVMFGP